MSTRAVKRIRPKKTASYRMDKVVLEILDAVSAYEGKPLTDIVQQGIVDAGKKYMSQNIEIRELVERAPRKYTL